MAIKEDKKNKTSEETPKLVEVYGKDVDQTKNLEFKTKNSGEKEKNKKTSSSGAMMEQNKKKTSEEVVKEILEDRQTLKTEVVDLERENNKEKSVKEENKDELIANIDTMKDEIAFENEIGSQRRAVKSVFGVGVVVFLAIFGITGWAFYLKSVWLPKEAVSEVVVEATPSPAVESTPKPIPDPISREEIILDVFNGSGITGLAGKTANIFEELGYEVGDIGNAEDVDVTQLYVKEDIEDRLTLLYEDFLEEFGEASVSGYLEDDVDASAKIVLGN